MADNIIQMAAAILKEENKAKMAKHEANKEYVDKKHKEKIQQYKGLNATEKAKYNTQNQFVLSKLAKTANDRMRDLEKAYVAKGGDAKQSPAYIQAKKWLAENTEGRVKFAQRTATMDPKQVAAEIKRVKQFLAAETSTATKHEKVREAAKQRLLDRGVKEKDLKQTEAFLRSQVYHKLMSKLPSDQVMQLIVDKKFRYLMKYESLDMMSNWVREKTNKLLDTKVLDMKPKNQEDLFKEEPTVQEDAQGTKKKRGEEPPLFGR